MSASVKMAAQCLCMDVVEAEFQGMKRDPFSLEIEQEDYQGMLNDPDFDSNRDWWAKHILCKAVAKRLANPENYPFYLEFTASEQIAVSVRCGHLIKRNQWKLLFLG